ncbi:MAG: translation initiation factor IF-2, partial [Fibrobacterales bacterium]|nr:translation initiation factor IF-2 [Fibrobacterales bacterium]
DAAKRGGHGSGPRGSAKKKGKDEKRTQEQEHRLDPRQSVNRVMAQLSKTPAHHHHDRRGEEEGEGGEERPVLRVSDFITVSELAGLLGVLPARVIAKCMELGKMATINQRIDFETIQLLAMEFGYEAELMDEYVDAEGEEEAADETALVPRPPVVTVMGHVDHGKTSLLDWIRKSHVAKGEAGGITQHVGAYRVQTAKGMVTFLDTPGHEAFSAMRARGSQITDVIVLVVAADSMVMPQTIESIEHAKSAKVPIVVAITKCDLETANPDRIRAQLAEHGVNVEQWGGQTSCVEISSKTGMGMDTLLETLALETEILELKANPDMDARGVVIESRLDKGKGAVATVLVQNGTLRVGDPFVAGIYSGKVRALLDESGAQMKSAGPGVPCQIMGLDGAPFAGDKLTVHETEKEAREIAGKRRAAAKERELRSHHRITLGEVYDRVKAGNFTELNLVVKADVDGSAEALTQELEKLSNREVAVNVIRKAVGNINESDVQLAAASNAMIVAFHLLPAPAVRAQAEEEGVEIKQYRIIYDCVEEFKNVVEGMLKPIVREEVAGEAEVKQLFHIPKVGLIAGCIVTNGTVDLEAKLRIYRKGREVGVAKVTSLKRHQEEVTSVKVGFECGIGVGGIEDVQVDDTLAFFKEVKIKRTLADVK